MSLGDCDGRESDFLVGSGCQRDTHDSGDGLTTICRLKALVGYKILSTTITTATKITFKQIVAHAAVREVG